MAIPCSTTPLGVTASPCPLVPPLSRLALALDEALRAERERTGFPLGDPALAGWDLEADARWTQFGTLARRLWRDPRQRLDQGPAFLAFLLDLALRLRDPEDARALAEMLGEARGMFRAPSLTRAAAAQNRVINRLLDRLPEALGVEAASVSVPEGAGCPASPSPDARPLRAADLALA